MAGRKGKGREGVREEGRRKRGKKERRNGEGGRGRWKERREIGKKGRNRKQQQPLEQSRRFQSLPHSRPVCCSVSMNYTHKGPGSFLSVYMCLSPWKHLSGSSVVPVFKHRTSSSSMAPKSKPIISTCVQLKESVIL